MLILKKLKQFLKQRTKEKVYPETKQHYYDF